jgi:hypothetical protein
MFYWRSRQNPHLISRPLNWAVDENITSVITILIFAVLVFDRLFIDKGYYESVPQDLFGYFDGIYRVHLGQIPNRDFSTTLGPLHYLFPSLFMRFGADPLSSVRYYEAALLAFCMVVVLYIQRTRLSTIVGIVLAAFIALTLAAKLTLGDDNPQDVTESELYNRIGYVFLILQVLLCAGPRPGLGARRFAILDGAIIGLLCIFSFYTKITFGLVGMGLIAIHLFDDRSWRQKFLSIASSLAVILIVMVLVELVYGVHFRWLQDARMAQLSVEGLRTWKTPVRKVLLSFMEVAGFVLAPLLIVWIAGSKIPRFWFLYGAYIVAASGLLVSYSLQGPVLFLPIAFLLYVTAKIDTLEPAADSSGNRVTLANYKTWIYLWCIWSLAALSYPFLYNVIYSSIMYRAGTPIEGNNKVLQSIRTRAPFETAEGRPVFDALNHMPPLDVFSLGRTSKRHFQGDFLSVTEFGIYVSDGMNAALQGCPAQSRIATLDVINPFPAMLGWPEGGGMIFTAPGYLLSDRSHPSAEAMYGKIDCLLAPKLQVGEGTEQFIQRTYGEYFKDHFKQTYESQFWIASARANERTSAN